MDAEAQIAARLQANIAQPSAPLAPPVKDKPASPTGATIAVNLDLDELTLYKLHNYFGQTYSPTDTETVARVKYIYDRVSAQIHNGEYGHVVSQVHQMMRKNGIANSDNKIYKLYQWLKLDGVRQGVQAEMEALGGYGG